MRCALARPVLIFFIAAAAASSSWSAVTVAEGKDAAMQLKLLSHSEQAKVRIVNLETPQAKNRPQAGTVKPEISVTQDSGETPYGAVVAAFVLMGAIAIRRHLSGRS